MSVPIISIENLGKSYLVGHKAEKAEAYSTLRDSLTRATSHLISRTVGMLRGQQLILGDSIEEFWALRNLSFNVNQGDVLGIIGHNGAGKSTFLKLLSRITDPTEGRIVLRGRVASLLEVGTGFHPELSGRENIYLNGAILGMSRREITKKFGQIVEFAEVNRFLDTPVKRYSSGMYVRLAFAVAAHMDPEILVVDEVLAVGDTQFQRKCLGKMQDIATQEGRTVLFVSHNMSAIKSLCNRAVCLDRGRLVADGSTDSVLQKYLQASTGGKRDGTIDPNRLHQYGTGDFDFRSVQLVSPSSEPVQAVETGSPLRFVVQFVIHKPLENVFIELSIADAEGRQLTLSRMPDHSRQALHLQPGHYEVSLESHLQLFPGSYSVLLGAHHFDGATIDWIEQALDFEVLNAPADSPLHHPWTVRGFCRPEDKWSQLTLVTEQ